MTCTTAGTAGGTNEPRPTRAIGTSVDSSGGSAVLSVAVSRDGDPVVTAVPRCDDLPAQAPLYRIREFGLLCR